MSKTEPLGSLPASLPTDAMAAPADVIAGYRVIRPLGEGGMASVFLAEHTQTGQQVALKRIKEQARADAEFKERFLREVRAASKLDHKNICKVFAGGEDGASVYMACELLSGGDLDHLLKIMGGRLPAAAVCVVVCELLEALDHAHQAGLIHRDIKPANVMLDANGVTKLVDFGIAKSNEDQKLTATGLVVGTPAYMSPEQARGWPLDARSDLFSVGVLLVELLTGANPFSAESATATVMRILLEPAPPLFTLDPTAPGVLQRVASGLLDRDPNHRYPQARAALDDLAPYRSLVESAHPQLLQMCLADPERARRTLLADQARFELDRAADLEDTGEVGLPAAALALFRATRLEPDSSVALQRFQALCTRGHFDFAPSDKRVLDVEKANADAPHNPALLKRAADVHGVVKNPHGQAVWLSRYLQMQPADQLAQHQWQSLVSGPPPKGETTRVKLTTREIVDGIKTGGWKGAAAATEMGTAARAPVPVTKPVARVGQAQQRHVGAGPIGTAAGGGNAPIVVVAAREDAPSGRGPVWAGAALLVVVGIGGLYALRWSGKETAKQVEHEFTQAAHAVNTDDKEHDMTLRELQQAEDFLLRKATMDALVHADAALRMTPTGNEAASAYYIKAKARQLDGDARAEERELKQYFDTAPPNHPRYAEAKAMFEKLPGARTPPAGATGGAP